ncbi:MAG: membrane associated rhomboid family serine protease [Limisphaerales bacterium]|jgi:membrane associated rhomboid family serine protease
MSLFNSIWADVKRQFQYGNMVNKIIIANLSVWLLVLLVQLVMFFMGLDSLQISQGLNSTLLSWFAMPLDFKELLYKPWTLISYMFLHVGLMHILWNMLFLYWFGNILQEFLGNRNILPIYFYGGVSGGVLALLAYTFMPNLSAGSEGAILLGASAGVSAILIAAATLSPDYTMFLMFLGPVKIKYIAVVKILLDLIALPSFDNVGGSIAHLGGVVFGYLFITQLQSGRDWSVGFNKAADMLTAMFESFGRKGPHVAYKNENPKSIKRVKVKQGTTAKSPAAEPNGENLQEQVDAILDKINKSGYDSLSKEEKEFLFRYSKK